MQFILRPLGELKYENFNVTNVKLKIYGKNNIIYEEKTLTKKRLFLMFQNLEM